MVPWLSSVCGQLVRRDSLLVESFEEELSLLSLYFRLMSVFRTPRRRPDAPVGSSVYFSDVEQEKTPIPLLATNPHRSFRLICVLFPVAPVTSLGFWAFSLLPLILRLSTPKPLSSWFSLERSPHFPFRSGHIATVSSQKNKS